MGTIRIKAPALFTLSRAWTICVIAMLFYCFNYFLRVSPSVMQSELSEAFHIDAYQFGALASLYYWAYTPMQVPAGMIYDKFGARFVLFFACLTAALGLAIFISADSFRVAGAGRFLIGLGTAFAYIGVLKLASLWLPPNRFATVAGLTTAVGMTFGALSQRYLAPAVEVFGYKQALHTALIIGIILSFIVLFVVRSRPKNSSSTATIMHTPMDFSQLKSALRMIFTNKQMWLIGLIGCLLYLPASVFLDLWGVDYLKTVYQLSEAEAVNVSNLTFLGWIIGGPVIGMLSDKIRRRRMPLVASGFIAALALSIIFYMPGLTLNELYAIFFLVGFCCGSHPLCFPLGKENNPVRISGTAVAVTNMFIMLGGMIFQPLAGLLLDLHSTTIGTNGLHVYTAADYTFALSVVPVGVAIGILLSVFLKETHCQSQAKEEDERVFAPSPELVAEGEIAR